MLASTTPRVLFVFAAALLAGGCKITTKMVNIGQKTSLERQLMGELEPLTEEEILAASVRAPGGVQAGSADDLQSRALAARRRQLFNRDDVDDLKRAGCLGEARAATLVPRDCDQLADAAAAALRQRLIIEENADRAAIIDWAVATDPVLTRTDRPQIVAILHRLLLEQARPGDWLQAEDSTWTRR